MLNLFFTDTYTLKQFAAFIYTLEHFSYSPRAANELIQSIQSHNYSDSFEFSRSTHESIVSSYKSLTPLQRKLAIQCLEAEHLDTHCGVAEHILYL